MIDEKIEVMAPSEHALGSLENLPDPDHIYVLESCVDVDGHLRAGVENRLRLPSVLFSFSTAPRRL